MTKSDMRVKKSLTKIRHALCKILSSTPELTDYNFSVGIIAKTAGISQFTVRRRIREFERESGRGAAGRRISPWTLFELFNTEVMEELKQRRDFQNKIGVEKSTGDFFMRCLPPSVTTVSISVQW